MKDIAKMIHDQNGELVRLMVAHVTAVEYGAFRC